MLATLSGVTIACNSSPVTIAPPRITYGGRAVAISVRPGNDKQIVVAAETGGLFRTFDGGKSWQHLNNLPNNRTIDVMHASLAPDVIIATTWSQYRTVSDGGIWRSIDGGGTWTQPSGWTPPPSRFCPSRPNAYGISHLPLSRKFFVGTDCGLAVSNDNGATWSYVVLDGTTSRWDSAYNRIRSVSVIDRTSGVLAGERELWRLNSAGNWEKVVEGPTPTWRLPPIHSVASAYWTGSSIYFYATGDRTLWVSSDKGASWSHRQSPGADLREAFVRLARPLSKKDQSEIDVYYGDGMKMHRQTFSLANLSGIGSWTNLPSDHEDPADIGFDVERRVPILLASDGGVHVTSDRGAHWKLTGGGYGGFTALQITEVTGQVVSGSKPHHDLYFVTHDNDFKASPDGGATWPGYECCEGRDLRVLPTSVDHDGVMVTGLACGPCSILNTNAHLATPVFWPSAPNGLFNNNAGAPFPLAHESYLQNVTDTGPPVRFDYYLTTSAGAAWRKVFSLTSTPVGPPLFTGSPANPTVFQGVQQGWTLTNGGAAYGLIRIAGIAGQAVIGPADSAGIVGIGSMRNTNARVLAVGVDPQNANHLIAPDVGAGEMKFSADGGRNWFPLARLTTAVTDSGRFLFTLRDQSFATVVAWDPYDSCHILVGTHQNGIIRSTDGGNRWARIPGSHHVTDVSWFYFPPTGVIWIASDGRGLWNLSVQRRTGSAANGCRFPSPPGPYPTGGVETDAEIAELFAMKSSGGVIPSEVEPGGKVRIIGNNFAPPGKPGRPVRILFDDQVVAPAVTVRSDGTFSVELPVLRPPGEMIITAEQPGTRLRVVRTSIEVAGHDRIDRPQNR